MLDLLLCEELSAHPDFQAGLRDAQEWFLEEYDAAPLTEEEMIEKVESNLGRRVVEGDKAFCQRFGGPIPTSIILDCFWHH